MSSATEATSAALSEEHVGATAADAQPQDNAALDSNTTANGVSEGGERDHIERDVSNILAGLNQEQLASIVAAARASEARETERMAVGLKRPQRLVKSLLPQEVCLQVLGRLRVRSLASLRGLNAHMATIAEEGFGDAPPPPGVNEGEFTQQSVEEGKDEGEGEEELDADTSAAIAAVKNATDTATAAAIASLGS